MYLTSDSWGTTFTIVPGWYLTVAPVAGARIPVLSHPSVDVHMIAQIPAGSRIEVIAQQGVWLRVKLPDAQIGYISTINVKPVSPGGADFTASQQGMNPVSTTVIPQALSSSQIIVYSQRQSNMGGVIALSIIFGVMLIAGILIGTTAIVSCPFGTTNPYPSDCSVQAIPFAGTGLVLTIIGLVGMIIAIAVAISSRSKQH